MDRTEKKTSRRWRWRPRTIPGVRAIRRNGKMRLWQNVGRNTNNTNNRVSLHDDGGAYFREHDYTRSRT